MKERERPLLFSEAMSFEEEEGDYGLSDGVDPKFGLPRSPAQSELAENHRRNGHFLSLFSFAFFLFFFPRVDGMMKASRILYF
jgi:hypothetical protein